MQLPLPGRIGSSARCRHLLKHSEDCHSLHQQEHNSPIPDNCHEITGTMTVDEVIVSLYSHNRTPYPAVRFYLVMETIGRGKPLDVILNAS
jgi:hypothetical protein